MKKMAKKCTECEKAKMKKGGMVAYEKSAYDKKADKLGSHGKEGSAKDMKADKDAAKKLGYMKKGGSASAFAKLAPPYNKVTFADKIAGAKKKSKK